MNQELQEGQIYQGAISASGSDGPDRKWIVLAPFGKTHACSLDDPADLHWLPLSALRQGIADGRLKLVATDPEHPVLQLQRAKERMGIRDAHLGLSGANTEKMLELLNYAVEQDEPYAPYAAREILDLINEALYSSGQIQAIRDRVTGLLSALTHPAPSGDGPHHPQLAPG